MRRYFTLCQLLLWFTLSNQLYGQEAKKSFHKNIFIEQVGFFVLPLYTSINYDMRFAKGIQNKWGFRIGVGYGRSEGTTINSNSQSVKERTQNIPIPLEINYLFGKRQHTFELGAGALIRYQRFTQEMQPNGNFEFYDKYTESHFLVSIMYRFQPINNGLYFSSGFRTIFTEDYPFPFFSVGIGYGFK